jgi:hypothetical protein
MTRLTLLFIAVALVLPGAALAMPADELSGAQPQATQDLRAPDRGDGPILAAHGTTAPASQVGAYSASSGPTKSLPTPADEPAAVATDGNGVGWTLAIGSGIALMLLAGGLGVYAGRTIRPRHLGA